MNKFCECGCGKPVTQRFIRGHNTSQDKFQGPNDFQHLPDGITVIWLEQRNGNRLSCFIDTSDHDLIKNYRWYPHKTPKTFYARTEERKTRQTIYLHQLLFGTEADHKDYDGLNNRRSNLRSATRSQNTQNTRKREGRSYSSLYKGVSFHKQSNKFRAQLLIKGKTFHLGEFGSEIDAAQAYDAAARKHFGEFATLNFPQPKEQTAFVGIDDSGGAEP